MREFRAIVIATSDGGFECASITDTREYTFLRLSSGSSWAAIRPSETILSRCTERVDWALPVIFERSVRERFLSDSSWRILRLTSLDTCTSPFLV